MVSPKDKGFLEKMGGRTMTDEKDKKLGKEEKEPSAVDRIIEARIRGEETRAAIEGLGGSGKEEKPESESLKLANQAMELQASALKSADEARKLTQDALTKAETAKNEALTALYTFQMGAIQDAENRVKAAAEKQAGGGEAKSAIEVYKEVKAEIGSLVQEMPKPSETPTGIDAATMIKLKEMDLEQARVLAKMEADQDLSKREWDLKLLEFNEESRRRWAEYRDEKEFRERGLQGFEDLAGSIAEGITSDREGRSSVKTKKSAKEPTVEASISQFPCQFCKTSVPVIPGDTVAVCPNEECGAEYEIRTKA